MTHENESQTRRLNGLLVVDKPAGFTSHDVVARARRALRLKRIGHAGTLDPMATGVLVLALAEGTKLVPYLTDHDKEYEATIKLGIATDSLDADGQVVETRPVSAISLEDVVETSNTFVGVMEQQVPVVSAVRVKGQRLHRRFRRGETVAAPIRQVQVHQLQILDVRVDEIDLRVCASKGFYVRSLARDLARALGTCGHLSRLRRLRSGTFHISDAMPFEAFSEPERIARSMCSLASVLSNWPSVTLTADGERDARHGRPIPPPHWRAREQPPEHLRDRVIALISETGAPVALGKLTPESSTIHVTRGFGRV